MEKQKPLSAEQWALWSRWTAAQQFIAQKIDQRLQSKCGISKAEFSVLMTLLRSSGNEMPMSALVEALDWEKSRLSHQVTRMEKRGFVQAASVAGGRRTAIALTATGRRTAEQAIIVHGESVRRYFLDTLSSTQEGVIRHWCDAVVSRDDPIRPGPRSSG